MNLAAAIKRAEAVDREETKRAEAPVVTKHTTDWNQWSFWGGGRAVTVWQRPDKRFQVTIYRARPMCIAKDFTTDDPPRTVAQAEALKL